MSQSEIHHNATNNFEYAQYTPNGRKIHGKAEMRDKMRELTARGVNGGESEASTPAPACSAKSAFYRLEEARQEYMKREAEEYACAECEEAQAEIKRLQALTCDAADLFKMLQLMCDGEIAEKCSKMADRLEAPNDGESEASSPAPSCSATIPLPEKYCGLIWLNSAGTDRCDMLEGPCACGGWHSIEDWFDRFVVPNVERQRRASGVSV